MGFNTLGDSGSSILQAGARLFWLSMVLHVITLPCGYDVGAISFAYSGFKSTDVYIVPGSPWAYNSTTGAFYLALPTNVYGDDWAFASVSGRILYYKPVQMKDPTTMVVKSFSTSFIFQILINDTSTTPSTGSGLAFLMVPDNVTIGGNLDHMGLITANTTETSPNLQSDNHTLGVEFDTYRNSEFGDPNDNHVGVDLTSMTSSYVFVPSLIMASEDAEVMRQVWIDYDQSDARLDIYINSYGQEKPATPEGSTQGVDLSFLLEEMYVGFSAAVGIESNNLHTVLAWSFSNEGEAPPISIQSDAPTSPGASPPPLATKPGPGGPVPAPNPPVSPPVPAPATPPAPINTAPPPSNTTPSLPPTSSNPPPYTPPSPPPPVPVPSPAPSNEPPSPSPKPKPKPKPVELIIVFSVLGGAALLLLCWKIYEVTSHPVRIFLSHAGGEDKDGKNFPDLLYKELKSTWRYKFNIIKVFFDRESLPIAEDIPEEILEELDRTHVGVVIVTEEFFESKWPMKELRSFVDSKNKHPKGERKILPLFYRLSADEVKAGLRAGSWDEKWRKMSSDKHPVDVQEYRAAVTALCNIKGIEYNARDNGHDLKYIKEILEKVVKISDKLRSRHRRSCCKSATTCL